MARGNYLYVMRYGETDSKIGISVRPQARLKQLRGVGAALVTREWHRPAGDAQRVEVVAHRLLAPWRHQISGQRERFSIGEAAACQAVDLAIALYEEERAETARREAAAAAEAARLAGRRPLPALVAPRRHVGYVRRATAREACVECDLLAEAGVELARLYVDVGRPGPGLRSARKACGEGDVLVIAEDERVDTETLAALAARGVAVHAILPAIGGGL